MKKIIFISIFLSAFLISSISGCKKNVIDKGCGCNTDSVSAYVSYDNFLGYNYNGYLNYLSDGNQPGWYVGVNIPNSNYFGISKICNPGIPSIKAFTDTSSKKYLIPVYFAGELKKLCPGETFGLWTLPETVFFYITIDSLTKR